MSFQDDEQASERLRLDAQIDQEDADSRERARREPGTFPFVHSELARRSLAKILSKSLEEHEAECQQKYEHTVDKLDALIESDGFLVCTNKYVMDSECSGSPTSCPIIIRFPDGEILEWFTVHTRTYWENVIYLRADSSIDEDLDRRAKADEMMAKETTRFGVNLSVELLKMEDLQAAVEIWCRDHCSDRRCPHVEWLSGQSAIDLVGQHIAEQNGFETYADYRDFLDAELRDWALVDAEMEEQPQHPILRLLGSIRERLRSMMRRFRS